MAGEEYQSAYTGKEIDERLGKVPGLEASVSHLSAEKVDKTSLTLGLHADGKYYIFVDGAPVGTGFELSGGASGDLFGYVDENNNVVLNGNLPDGTYTIKYEMTDGSVVEIGDLVLDNNVYYSVTNTLTNCTTSNSDTQGIGGQSYSATISANSGYELSSVVVTMGGVDVSASAVSGDNISIANVTGNIVITAVATEIVVTPTYTNLAKNFTSGRFNSSGEIVAQDGATTCTDYIQAVQGDVIRVKGFGALTDFRTIQYGHDKGIINIGIANALTDAYATYSYDSSNGIVTLTMIHGHSCFVRFSGILTGTTADVIITRNEEIV